jgi:antitoxin component of MazEF toxin-antitoxin module
MIKKLIRVGDELAVVLDKAMLEELGIDENTEVDVSIKDDVLVVTPILREQRFRASMEKIDREYADVFRRLADS